MSIWTKIRDAARKVVGAVAPVVLPGVGNVISAATQKGFFTGGPPATGFGQVPASMSALPALPTVARTGAMAVGGLVGVGVRSASRIASAAASMCRKYPQWCVSIGGTAAIASMMESGQIPLPKRRRRRGITPRDLQSFKRVASLIKTYAGPARKVPTRCAPRKKC